MLHNKEAGRFFALTYSAIKHILSAMRAGIKEEPDLKVKYDHLYSLYKM